MNVVWIMVDQMRGDCAGFMGHPVVKTSNLDRLAGESVVFENTFAQSPLCGPSRTCLFTGRYVHEHGVWWNGVPYRAGFPLLPEILRQAGYYTSIVGKLHYAPPRHDFGFDVKELHEECLLDGTDLESYEQFLQSSDPAGAASASESTEWLNEVSGLGICRMDERREESRWVADRTCRFLKSQPRNPFFLFSSFDPTARTIRSLVSPNCTGTPRWLRLSFHPTSGTPFHLAYARRPSRGDGIGSPQAILLK